MNVLSGLRAGFTIVELLITIVVIAIFAAISTTAYGSIQARAKNTQIMAAAESYAEALKLYAIDNGTLPSSAQAGGSYTCLGNYADGVCANFTGYVTRTTFDNLLSQYRGSSSRPDLPEEYIYTNNYNNWWRGVTYYADQTQLQFIQYKTSQCPLIAGTTFVSSAFAYNTNILCRVRVEV